MIPKIVHYCWFGSDKPGKIRRRIESWKKLLPDYEIWEWNEKNFDVYSLPYTSAAYRAGKYAFVSDVARVHALFHYGGIYLDTDVKVYQNFDSILSHRCVLGFEEELYVATSFMACEPKHPLMKQFLLLYENLAFYDENGEPIPGTNVEKLTRMLEKRGLQRKDEYQELSDGITVYPQEYFSPYDYANCLHHNTERTICEHLFAVSWLPGNVKIRKGIKQVTGPLIGKEKMDWTRKKLEKFREYMNR